jgi:hypothetical protein
MSDKAPTIPSSTEIDAFLTKMQGLAVKTTAIGGRLVFALDATASRQPTWDSACELQAEMFREVATIGGLSVQLVYYRGLAECRSSRWVTQPEHLSGMMERVDCRMGHTQLGKVLTHARRESELLKVQALVFVGDAMEENPDDLAHDAAALGKAGVPAFMFQEGTDRKVEAVFREIAQLTKGAYCRFDPGAAKQLAELLRAVATFTVGGVTALENQQSDAAKLLLAQVR